MPLYLIFAWFASFLYGVEVIVMKLTSRYSIANAWLFNFLWTLIGALVLMPVAINKVSLAINWNNIIAAAVFTALTNILLTFAIYNLDVSVLSPLFNFRTVFAVIFGIILLGEKLKSNQFIFVIVIFLAGFFVTLDEKMHLKSFFKKSVAIALIGMLSLALSSVYTNKAIAQVGYWNTNLWVALLTSLILSTTAPFFYKDFRSIKIRQILMVVIIAILSLFGTLAANKAYSENVGISSVIISLPFSMVLAFLFSVFAPKLLEKHTMTVYLIRFTAAAVMFLAALKLSS